MYEIVDSSDEMKSRIITNEDKFELDYNSTANQKYPFNFMEIGKSFLVPFNEVKGSSLRFMVSNKNSDGGKKFSVKRWSDHNCYEVGRIA